MKKYEQCTLQSLPSKSKKKKKKNEKRRGPGGRKKKSEEEQHTDEALCASAHEFFIH